MSKLKYTLKENRANLYKSPTYVTVYLHLVYRLPGIVRRKDACSIIVGLLRTNNSSWLEIVFGFEPLPYLHPSPNRMFDQEKSPFREDMARSLNKPKTIWGLEINLLCMTLHFWKIFLSSV